MSVQTQKKRIESLYVLKAICAFFVVSIHTPIKSEFCTILAGIGTPCFLSITGYLLFSANQERELWKCRTWALKSFWLALVFNIIYGLANVFIFDVNFLLHSKRFYVFLTLFGTGMHPVLWYLTALCEALLILYCIIKWAPKLMYALPLLFIVAYTLRNLGDGYYVEFLQLYSVTVRNTCIVTSLPFLATGYLIHKYQDVLLKSIKVNLFAPVFLVLCVVEYYLRKEFGQPLNYFYICTYPLVVLLMLLCIKYESFTVPVLGGIGKHHSPNIYYFHCLFIAFASMLNITSSNAFIYTLGLYLVCLPCSYLYNFLSQKWKTYIWQPALIFVCKTGKAC